MKAKKHLATVMAATMVVSGSVVSVNAATSEDKIVGSNRTDTAVKISKDGWASAETVILVNDSAIPDALTATPLAHAKNAPILLTGKNGLNKATADEIKRLGAKNVIMIGGDAVLPAKIEKALKDLKVKTDRVKGATREETALAIAKRLDGIKDVSEIAVVNGTTGLADAVSVAAAAAEKGMPIILANPKKGLSVAEKFIKAESIKASFVIGGKTALPEKLVYSLPGKQRVEGSNRNDTNAKVIEKFYGDKELDNLYLAKDGRGGDSQLIDALAVGALAAKNGAPVLIASKKLNATQVNVINTKKVATITQVGGKGNEGAFNHLKDIEKAEIIKVKSEAELQEALKKANANDIIEIEESVKISKDITLSTNNAIQINVRGELKGEVTVKTPNADIKNSGTIGTLVVENGKNTTVKNTSAGKISKVEISSSSSNVKLENDGKITNVENNANGTEIENYGTISNPVTGAVKPEVDGNKPGGESIKPIIPSVTYHNVSTKDELVKAIADVKKGEVIRLIDDITVDEQLSLSPSGETIIDLNGKTLKSTATNGVEKTKSFEPITSGKKLVIKNGSLEATSTGASVSCIKVDAGGSLTLDNVDYTTKGTGVFVAGDAAAVNVINGSNLYAEGFCVSTNAATVENYNVVITLNNSIFRGGKGGAPVLVNVPCTLNITDSQINGLCHGVIVRGGTATITGTTITNYVENQNADHLENWGQGNQLPQAALVVGNRPTGAYQYASNVTLNNCTITQTGDEKVPAIYMYGNVGKRGDGYIEKEGKTELEYIGAILKHTGCTINRNIYKGNDKCTINDETIPQPNETLGKLDLENK